MWQHQNFVMRSMTVRSSVGVHLLPLTSLGCCLAIGPSPLISCDSLLAGLAVIKWPSEKNKDGGNCACIVTVFGSAYFIG